MCIWPCERRTQHRKDSICSLATWEEGSTQAQWLLFSPAFTLKPHNSIVPYVSLETPQSLSLCWSSGQVPGNKRVCVDPLKGCSDFQLPSISPGWRESWLIFTARCSVGCSFWQWCSKLGSLVWAGATSCSEQTFAAKISFLILYCHTWVWSLHSSY